MPFFTTSDGIKLSYTDQGSGNVILCLPGLTRNQSDFDEFLASTTIQARIVVLTSRGRVPSQFDPNWKNYNVLQEAADAIALLDDLQIDRVMILGTSRGGIIGMVLAQFHHDRVAGLVLNDIGPEISAEGLARIGVYLGVAPEWDSLEDAITATKNHLGAQFPNLPDSKWETLVTRWNGYINGKFESAYDLNLKKSFDQTNADVDLWPFFNAIGTKPIGVIWGVNSDLLTKNVVDKMKARNTNLQIAEIADRGHVPFLDEEGAQALINNVFGESFY